MKFSYSELKGCIYIFQSLLGAFMLAFSLFLADLSDKAIDPIAFLLPACVLLMAGTICLLFGIGTFILKDDPDVWR